MQVDVWDTCTEYKPFWTKQIWLGWKGGAGKVKICQLAFLGLWGISQDLRIRTRTQKWLSNKWTSPNCSDKKTKKSVNDSCKNPFSVSNSIPVFLFLSLWAELWVAGVFYRSNIQAAPALFTASHTPLLPLCHKCHLFCPFCKSFYCSTDLSDIFRCLYEPGGLCHKYL